MRKYSIPDWGALHYKDPKKFRDCAPHITFTRKVSGIDFSEENGIVGIVWAANNYHNFTLPAYDTVDYCLIAMSLQINKKTQDTCDAMQTCAVLERKKNIGNEQKLYINDHTHLMQSTSRKKITIF
ncbi:hypothetical protein PSHT_15968 [Puccinia striiformis]|uniref:Uncharacterized protein n=1 Tax=Puccinia striiformis TaxID=27350 RepID=A0A2S4UC92_9BASI|nr:hypothetical protein PSHT_15968 [Puccinia striiformis]